jgi:hypothetical protein
MATGRLKGATGPAYGLVECFERRYSLHHQDRKAVFYHFIRVLLLQNREFRKNWHSKKQIDTGRGLYLASRGRTDR